MKLKAICLSLAAATTFGATSMAMADGAALFAAKLCNTCHGADANSPTTTMYPKLGGLDKAYLLEQMKDIRDGKRTNGMTIAMKATVASVTDEDFEAMAEWLSAHDSFSGAVSADDAAAALFKEKGCNTCHGDDAVSSVVNDENGNPPKLASQTEQYLMTQMKDIRDGKRANGTSDKMKAKVEGISDDDLQKIAKWLSTAAK
jgi:cytochrome c